MVFTIKQRTTGRRVGRRCRKPTRRNAERPRCVRLLNRGSFARPSVAGDNLKPFSGRIGTRALSPGRYTATLAAQDAAGNVSGPVSGRRATRGGS